MTALFEARPRENGTFGVWCTGPSLWAVHPNGSAAPYEFGDLADAQELAKQWTELHTATP